MVLKKYRLQQPKLVKPRHLPFFELIHRFRKRGNDRSKLSSTKSDNKIYISTLNCRSSIAVRENHIVQIETYRVASLINGSRHLVARRLCNCICHQFTSEYAHETRRSITVGSNLCCFSVPTSAEQNLEGYTWLPPEEIADIINFACNESHIHVGLVGSAFLGTSNEIPIRNAIHRPMSGNYCSVTWDQPRSHAISPLIHVRCAANFILAGHQELYDMMLYHTTRAHHTRRAILWYHGSISNLNCPGTLSTMRMCITSEELQDETLPKHPVADGIKRRQTRSLPSAS